jgi:hypothetical protein
MKLTPLGATKPGRGEPSAYRGRPMPELLPRLEQRHNLTYTDICIPRPGYSSRILGYGPSA